MTKYRNYKEPYNVDLKRLSIYNALDRDVGKNILSIGDEVDITIKYIDDDGRGVGFYRGYKILVPKGFMDEKVRVKIVKILDNALLGVVVHRYSDK